MKHIKLIFLSHLLSAVSLATLNTLWYVFTDGENLAGKFFVFFLYAIFGIPILILIIAYHYSLLYLTEKKQVRMSFIKKLVLMVSIALVGDLIILIAHFFSESHSSPLLLMGAIILLAIHTAVMYEWALYIQRRARENKNGI